MLNQDRFAHVFADGHVHLHPCFDLSKVLSHSAVNVRRAAARRRTSERIYGCLLLTESDPVNRFSELQSETGIELGNWQIRPGTIPETVVAEADGEPTFVVVAGRQIQTKERLEVLACGCPAHFGEGDALADVLEEGLRRARLCIIPWGFGKWTGARGMLVRELLDSPWACRITLGDNSGRLRFGPTPRLLDLARLKEIPILPGSDPFPFVSHVKRIGGYGFILHGEIDPERPELDVVRLLAGIQDQPPVYGSLQGPLAFLWNQGAIHIRNRIVSRQ